jgi:ABC-2 type transport system ATP-binding protein
MGIAVTINDLRKDFSGENALAGLSLDIPQGSIFGIIGADGAGKTTLLRICATLIAADAGSVRILTYDVNTEHQRIRAEIGYMPQKFSLYEDLTVQENMFFFADVFGVPTAERRSRIERLLTFSRMQAAQHRRAGQLSGGMKQKLALSCALIHTPRLLILDEPTTGVDPVSRNEFWKILRELQKDGITIIVSTPYMDEAEYCDEIVLMHAGRILLRTTPQAAASQYPLHLYRIDGKEGISLSYPAYAPVPAGLAALYPVGGNLHAASATEESPQRIFASIKEAVPLADTIEPVQPKINDLFFYQYLSVVKTASGPPPAAQKTHGGHNPAEKIRAVIAKIKERKRPKTDH